MINLFTVWTQESEELPPVTQKAGRQAVRFSHAWLMRRMEKLQGRSGKLAFMDNVDRRAHLAELSLTKKAVLGDLQPPHGTIEDSFTVNAHLALPAMTPEQERARQLRIQQEETREMLARIEQMEAAIAAQQAGAAFTIENSSRSRRL